MFIFFYLVRSNYNKLKIVKFFFFVSIEDVVIEIVM